jgi:hypothetical protein
MTATASQERRLGSQRDEGKGKKRHGGSEAERRKRRFGVDGVVADSLCPRREVGKFEKQEKVKNAGLEASATKAKAKTRAGGGAIAKSKWPSGCQDQF